MASLKLSFSKQNALFQLWDSLKMSNDKAEIIKALSNLKSDTISYEIAKYQLEHHYYAGYVYGSLLANYDILPDEIAKKENYLGVPLSRFIKNRVNKYVYYVRRLKQASDVSEFGTNYKEVYFHLLNILCGYSNNFKFDEERFQQLFPVYSYRFVQGFATGYSITFHEIAYQQEILTTWTDPLSMDVLKNYPYFTDPNVIEYRLDGLYLPFCQGENVVENFSTISFCANKGVYEKLKARNEFLFETKEVGISF